MAYKYLSKEILIGFDKYQYNSIDTSPVSKYVSHPLWNSIVEYYPKWLAPNVLTLSGFLFIVANVFHLAYHDNYFYASDDSHPEYPPVPPWVWLVTGIFVFVAHVLDGTDGKQARRTNCCGPLGELFDHGLDSWAASLLTICAFSVFGIGSFTINITHMFYLLLIIISMFHITHWEKYNSGVLYLPWSYDISQYGMSIMYCVTYFMGVQIWKFNVPALSHFTSGRLIEIALYICVFCLSVPLSLWNVYESHRDGTGKKRGLFGSMRPCVSVALCFGLFLWWAHVSPYDILRQQPHLFFIAVGTVFSNTQTRLIVSCMSDNTCETFNWLLLPLMVLVVGVQTLSLGVTELYLLCAYTLFVVAAHIHYGICVVNQLADHLDIPVFWVRQPRKQNTKLK